MCEGRREIYCIGGEYVCVCVSYVFMYVYAIVYMYMYTLPYVYLMLVSGVVLYTPTAQSNTLFPW